MKTISGWKAIAVAGVGLAAAVAVGVGPRLKQREALARVEADLARPRRVRVAPVRAGEATTEVTLPGTSTPFHSSLLYGKSTGFVRKNLVDVGDRVKAGQVLAHIDAPETAEEIRLAQARLEEAEANVGIAQSTAERANRLVASGAVSQQHGDDTRAQANSAVASVATRRAELQRLQVLRGYQQIVAPFDGVVTRRGTDPGALVGPAASGGVALFEVAAIDTLRVFVDVPDAYAADVKPELEARVFSPRDPAAKITGKVVRTSGVLEQATRTLRAEVHVKGDGPVLPGAFVYVRLAIPRARPAPIVPASALIVRKEGTLVAKVAGDRLTLARVVLGRDHGKELEILDGVSVGEQVVVNASDELEDGQTVEIVPLAK
ncbi:MAG: efflux RND transporter periplasmic adaptor subunit [Labilithrix sp.]|nr:efflux RND transporter periplasmic adaptor subunit [Labilithrix sp.]